MSDNYPKLVHETDTYKVCADKSVQPEVDRVVYQVINKEFDVVEEEVSRLPTAIYLCESLTIEMKERGWEEALNREKIKGSKLAVPQQLVS